MGADTLGAPWECEEGFSVLEGAGPRRLEGQRPARLWRPRTESAGHAPWERAAGGGTRLPRSESAHRHRPSVDLSAPF